MALLADILERALKLHQAGDLTTAEVLYRQALEIDPLQPRAWHLLGLVAHARGQLDEAIAHYRQALSIDAAQADAHCDLGSALKDQGRLDAAVESYRRALACNPRSAEAHFNLGVTLQAQGQRADAAHSYRQAIQEKPDYAQAYNNLGTLHKLADDLDQAVACYARALEFKPNFAEALNNLGNVLKTRGRVAEALICYEQTLRIQSDHAQARYNRALMHLAAGEFSAGWAEYEWRWRCPDFPRRTFSQPAFRGEPLPGGVLLVSAEQGLGDTLQFVRYVPQLARAWRSLVLEVPRPLVPLLAQTGFAGVELIAAGAALPEFDQQVPLMSLPGILGTTLRNIPAQVPYLSADPVLVAHWSNALAGPSSYRVGIAWQGSTTYPGDRFRSIPLPGFAPLAGPGVELISLQKGPGQEQLARCAAQLAVRGLGRFDEEHGPLMDTAAVMKNLDLVITSDTAIAHLAGALGVEVWVALALEPDWRWLRARDDSPWYPTMRLFRQTTFDDWAPVFAQMAGALHRRAAPRTA